MEVQMFDSPAVKPLLLLLRFGMAWIFIYAASHQILVPNWSVAGFLGNTKTFHWLFAPMTTPALAGVLSFLVGYGHLLIGLSLLSGLLVRVSGVFGAALMLLYWMAHMDFPYITDMNSLLVDDHIIYALVLGLLVATRDGHIFGLDQWAAGLEPVRQNKWLGWATS
jgi:thiosulfate dehydrogenase [quinone] large subunit